jgi:type I restriction enzyme S subunit
MAEWRTTPMGALCSIKNGKSNTEDAVEDGAYAFFDRSKQVKRSSKYLFDCEALIIPGEGTEFLPKKYNGKFDLHQRAYALYEFKDIDPKYLYYYLIHSKDYWPRVAVGATVKSLRLRHFEDLPIIHPPLPEQQRIVTKLDAAFAALSEAEANVERNRANARELFESYLNGVFEGREGWSRENLGALGRIMYGYTASSTSKPIGPKLLRITDIQDEQVEWTSVPHCLITDEDFSKYELRSGDIVFARTGATTGKSFLIESAPEAVFASYLIRVQVESADLLPEFLILFFRTRLYWDAIKAGTTGSAQGGFNATKLSDLMIPFPTKEEQMDIVRQANRLKDETKQLETTYQQKLMELEGLKKGLLGAAFRGEL